MKQITLEESKTIQLDIMSYVHAFCEGNGIRYALAGGSLIGAIRHGGFIPWDDDIDILMPRADYDRFVNQFNDNSNKYVLHNLETDGSYSKPFAKVEDSRTILIENSNGKDMGVSIDIFPLDYLADTFKTSAAMVKKVSLLRWLYKAKLVYPNKNNSLLKKIGICTFKVAVCLIPIRFLAKRLDVMCRTIGKSGACYCANLCWGYGIKEIIPSRLMADFISVKFESREYNTFKEYDLYLKTVYGDYMTLPSIDKRKSPHDVESIFWK